MQSPLVITPRGKLLSKRMADLDRLLNAPLQVTKYFMNQQDWEDIVKWGKE